MLTILTSVFMQYVDRGIILLDIDFVKEVCTKPNKDIKDLEFKLHLICNLVQEHQSIEVMKEIPEIYNPLCQHIISRIPARHLPKLLSPNVSLLSDMEVADTSPFIPLSVFLHYLKEETSMNNIDIPFVENASHDLIGQFFGISFQEDTKND